MNVTVEILGRTTMDGPFMSLVAPSVLAVPGAALGYTPALPAGAAAMDLRLRVQPVNVLNIDVGTGIDPANPPQPVPVIENGVEVGIASASAPVVRKTFGAFGGQIRDVPFSSGEAFLFRRSGAAA
jgi:hypothetical protein